MKKLGIDAREPRSRDKSVISDRAQFGTVRSEVRILSPWPILSIHSQVISLISCLSQLSAT